MPRRAALTAPERAPLLGAARAFLDAETARDPAPTATGLDRVRLADWARLIEGAEAERLAPLVHALASAAGAPAAVLDRLHPARVAFRRQHLLGTAQLRVLLDACEARGLPVIPLKGPALAERLYRDPGLRPFTDLDLLVPRPDVGRAVALLRAAGYRHLAHERSLDYELAHAAGACFVPADAAAFALPVDLHWDLVGFPSGAGARGLDTGEVWARAVTTARWGRPVRELAADDLLLYLALHLAVHHPLGGFPWQLDLALLLAREGRALDWDRVVERARRWGVAGAVYLALRSVERQLGVHVPALARLRPRGPRGALLDRLAGRYDARGRLDHAIDLLLLDRPGDLARALVAGLVPRPAWVRQRYGARSALYGYAAHARRLLQILTRR